MTRIYFRIPPHSSGDTFGCYNSRSKRIYIDLKTIAYFCDDTLGDKFIKALSEVIQHEEIHRVLSGFISEEASCKFDNLEFSYEWFYENSDL